MEFEKVLSKGQKVSMTGTLASSDGRWHFTGRWTVNGQRRQPFQFQLLPHLCDSKDGVGLEGEHSFTGSFKHEGSDVEESALVSFEKRDKNYLLKGKGSNVIGQFSFVGEAKLKNKRKDYTVNLQKHYVHGTRLLKERVVGGLVTMDAGEVAQVSDHEYILYFYSDGAKKMLSNEDVDTIAQASVKDRPSEGHGRLRYEMGHPVVRHFIHEDGSIRPYEGKIASYISGRYTIHYNDGAQEEIEEEVAHWIVRKADINEVAKSVEILRSTTEEQRYEDQKMTGEGFEEIKVALGNLDGALGNLGGALGNLSEITQGMHKKIHQIGKKVPQIEKKVDKVSEKADNNARMIVANKRALVSQKQTIRENNIRTTAIGGEVDKLRKEGKSREGKMNEKIGGVVHQNSQLQGQVKQLQGQVKQLMETQNSSYHYMIPYKRQASHFHDENPPISPTAESRPCSKKGRTGKLPNVVSSM